MGFDSGDGRGYATGLTELIVIGVLALAIVLIGVFMVRSMRRISVPPAEEAEESEPEAASGPTAEGPPADDGDGTPPGPAEHPEPRPGPQRPGVHDRDATNRR